MTGITDSPRSAQWAGHSLVQRIGPDAGWDIRQQATTCRRENDSCMRAARHEKWGLRQQSGISYRAFRLLDKLDQTQQAACGHPSNCSRDVLPVFIRLEFDDQLQFGPDHWNGVLFVQGARDLPNFLAPARKRMRVNIGKLSRIGSPDSKYS